jgi:hypothetical protein
LPKAAVEELGIKATNKNEGNGSMNLGVILPLLSMFNTIRMIMIMLITKILLQKCLRMGNIIYFLLSLRCS